MRDVAAERRDLGQHGALIGGFDRRQRVLDHDRAHDRERRGQADLEADVLGQLAALARRHEIEIGGARLPRIAQFAEAKRARIGAFGEGEQRESGWSGAPRPTGPAAAADAPAAPDTAS